MPILRAVLAAGLLWIAGTLAAAAGPFDGKWIAEIPPQGSCNGTSTMTLMVADGVIAGQVRNPRNVVGIDGRIDADGNATFSAMHRYPGTMKFTAEHFDATWFNGGCNRHAMGDRAPTDEQQRQTAEQRRQYQASFAELVDRAGRGDRAVDFTALRGAYPYTEQWDPYGNKSSGLMQEAAAAKKGGDCAGAMEKLDEVLKINFLIAEAHADRADCLDQAKDRAGSRIESAIADGLQSSLMHSGDGDSEKTAYVVNSMREEIDVLNKREIQIRTKQTDVRGSDGRFFDVVQGIHVGYGVSLHTVYFDTSAFVAGRQSRAAAVATAAAQIH